MIDGCSTGADALTCDPAAGGMEDMPWTISWTCFSCANAVADAAQGQSGAGGLAAQVGGGHRHRLKARHSVGGHAGEHTGGPVEGQPGWRRGRQGQAAVAKRCRVPRTRIERLMREEVPVTADTALRLGRALNTTPEFWMNMQTRYDLTMVCQATPDISGIQPLAAE